MLNDGADVQGIFEVVETQMKRIAGYGKPGQVPNTFMMFKNELKQRFPLAFRSTTIVSKKAPEITLPLTVEDLNRWQIAIDQATATDQHVDVWKAKFALLGVKDGKVLIAVWTQTIRHILNDCSALQAALKQQFPGLTIAWHVRDELVVQAQKTATLLKAA